jgi:small-conductance mechanosensitive channel
MWQSIEIKTKGIILLAGLLISAGAIAADKAYISVDESGRPMASDTPPAAGVVEEVIPLQKAPQTDAAKAQEEVQRINRKADQMAAERKQRQNERAAATEQKERQQVSCAASRSRLKQLESQPPNRRLVADPDGTTHRVSAEEMQELVAAAKRQVVEDCGSLDAPAASPEMKSGESPGSTERSKR